MHSKIHLIIEHWKYNKELNIYVSSLGNFKDSDKKDIKLKVSNSGYFILTLAKNHYQAHRVVLQTFKPKINCKELTVDHLNQNKRDNRLCNLEWCSQEENWKRAQVNLELCSKEESMRYLKLNGIVLYLKEAIKILKIAGHADSAEAVITILRAKPRTYGGFTIEYPKNFAI